LKWINEKVYSLELYHGPTLAFKDTGARFMSRCLAWFSKTFTHRLTVLVATSGDTGSAVANGFLDVDGVDVIILYPSGKVSHIQELQLTSAGKNITALEVRGSFDECQSLVKQAFKDKDLNDRFILTSANSINVARWLPQQFYYFFALQQWPHPKPPVISVPSGNFGNLCAGLLAHASGLPVRHFVAACNANKPFTDFVTTGTFIPSAPVSTISNAMDVGNPSNFVRILELFGNNYFNLKKTISSYSVSDQQTSETIDKVYRESGYLMEPHGAVAYRALEEYRLQNPDCHGMILETAHPIKFNEVVESITGRKIAIPVEASHLKDAIKKSILLNPDFAELKDYMMARGQA
jgi:threonine synthase